MMNDPTKRFSARVADYVRYRPSYPDVAIDWIVGECHLPRGARIADLGSGTGLLTRAFLDRGFPVTGVEPNGPMRAASTQYLKSYDGFTCVDGRAEETGLETSGVDLVVSGQAFHWFDPLGCRRECLRILRPPARAAMIWNQRALDDAFMTGYERLLSSRAPEYSKTGRNHLSEEALARFFGRGYRTFKAKNAQTFDRQSLHGRLNSSSYAPKAGTVDHAALARDLDRLFDMHVNDGRVTFRYDTIVYLGELS